jgi:hypothetical protein
MVGVTQVVYQTLDDGLQVCSHIWLSACISIAGDQSIKQQSTKQASKQSAPVVSKGLCHQANLASFPACVAT